MNFIKISVAFNRIDNAHQTLSIGAIKQSYKITKLIPSEIYEDKDYYYFVYFLDKIPVEVKKLKDAIGNTINAGSYAGSFIRIPANLNPIVCPHSDIYTEKKIYKLIKDYVNSDNRINWIDETGTLINIKTKPVIQKYDSNYFEDFRNKPFDKRIMDLPFEEYKKLMDIDKNEGNKE